jgi:hypothetical protein
MNSSYCKITLYHVENNSSQIRWLKWIAEYEEIHMAERLQTKLTASKPYAINNRRV